MHPLKSCSSVTLFAALCLVGCSGDDANRQDVYTVTGKITMQGGPVPNASVIFSPTEEQPVATGRTDATGTYTLTTYEPGDGAAPGKYVVLVSKNIGSANAAASGGHNPDDPYGAAAMHSGRTARQAAEDTGTGLPEKYSRVDQSTLEATVTAGGENKFDFDLQP